MDGCERDETDLVASPESAWAASDVLEHTVEV